MSDKPRISLYFLAFLSAVLVLNALEAPESEPQSTETLLLIEDCLPLYSEWNTEHIYGWQILANSPQGLMRLYLPIEQAPAESLQAGMRLQALLKWQLKKPDWPWQGRPRLQGEFLEAPRLAPQQSSAAAWRHQLSEAWKDYQPAHRQLLQTLILGQRLALSPEHKQNFRASGLAHLLAISGMHLVMMVFFFDLLLRLCFVRPQRRMLCLLVLTLFFWWLLPPTTPISRASLMLVIWCLGRLSRLNLDSFFLLSLAGTLILIADPWQAQEPGFQLSFAAVAGLFGFAPALSKALCFSDHPLHHLHEHYPSWWFRLRIALALSLSASLIAAMVTWPISSWHFHHFSFLSPLSNLLAIPCLTLTIPLSLLSFLHPAVSTFLKPLLELLSQALLSLSDFCALPESLTWQRLPSLLPWLITLLLLIVLALKKTKASSLRRFSILLTLVPLLGLLPLQFSSAASGCLVMPNVGKGDSYLLLGSSGEQLMIDCGSDREHGHHGLRKQAMNALNFNGLDALFLTHADRDHVQGLEALLKLTRPRSVFYNPQLFSDETHQRIMACLKSHDIKAQSLWQGDVLNIGQLEVRCLWPKRQRYPLYWDDNNLSLVLLIQDQNSGQRILLSGDAEEAAISQITPPELNQTWIAWPHHGSANAPFAQWAKKADGPFLISSRRDFVAPATWQALGAKTIFLSEDQSALRLELPANHGLWAE